MFIDRGLDYSLGRPNLGTVVGLGYNFVSRYLSWLPNAKVINATELAQIRAKFLQVALNWEFDAQDALRGMHGGFVDSAEAVRQAHLLGYTVGSTIYYSIDFNTTPSQYTTIDNYVNAARVTTHSGGYRIGVYGEYDLLKHLFDINLINDGWQARAWSNGFWEPRAAMRQVQNGVTIGGADCDIDERHGQTYLMGQTIPTPPPPPPPAPLPPKEKGMFINHQIDRNGHADQFAIPNNTVPAYYRFSTDFGNARIRFATHHYNGGWDVNFIDVSSEGTDYPRALPIDCDRVSVQRVPLSGDAVDPFLADVAVAIWSAWTP